MAGWGGGILESEMVKERVLHHRIGSDRIGEEGWKVVEISLVDGSGVHIIIIILLHPDSSP